MNVHRVFHIGGHSFTLNFPKGLLSEKELKHYAPFQTGTFNGNECLCIPKEQLLFHLTLVEDAEALSVEVSVTANFENENGKMAICTRDDGRMVVYLYSVSGEECCRMRISKDFCVVEGWIGGSDIERCYAFDTALMLLYAFASSKLDTLLIHASAVVYKGKGYLFLGKSGTGKSTHSGLWLEHVKGSELLNDDNPILRIIDGEMYVYGSPWSGKTPCYRNHKVPLRGIVRLHQAHFNKITPLRGVRAYAALQPSCSYMAWDKEMATAVHGTLSRIIEKIPMYSLECLPNRDAVLICKEVLE